MENPLVSVVVPFYNPDNYFKKLLESIENQSYKNIEVILVDDGSSNEINKIAKSFVEKNRKYLLITQKNSGVAVARQVGVSNAKGDFIIHADADDLLPENAIEKLVYKHLETNANIVIGSYIVRSSKKDVVVLSPSDTTIQNFIEGLILGKIHGSLCNKLIQRDLYEGIKFEPEINYMEDLLILAKILRYKKCKIASVKDVVYVYRQHAESTTANFSMLSVFSAEKVNFILADLYREKVNALALKTLERESRIFTIVQSARNKVYVFEKKDNFLLRSNEVEFKKRIFLWLIKFNFGWVVRTYYRFKLYN